MKKGVKKLILRTCPRIVFLYAFPNLIVCRGPKGVWTLEKKGLKPDMNVSWDDAKPTYTHMALSRDGNIIDGH